MYLVSAQLCCSGQAGKAGQVRAAHKSPIVTLTLRCLTSRPHSCRVLVSSYLSCFFNCSKCNLLVPPCPLLKVSCCYLFIVDSQ